MTAPVFPSFLRLEAKGTDDAKAKFLQAVEQTMSAGEARTGEFAATSQANIDKALRIPPVLGGAFISEIDRTMAAVAGKLETFSTSARRNLNAALSGKATATGGVDLDVAGAREAAAVAERRAALARQLVEATKAAAFAERDFSQATRLSIAAAKELATSETAAAQAARIQADAAEKLQMAMDRAGVSARGLANANYNAKVSAGQFRAGTQQLGFQISDLGVQLAMAGASANTGKMALMAFSQQTPQIIQAIGLMRGAAGGFVGFMSGPWGAALLAAGSILGTLALAHHDAADASDTHKKAAEDLKKSLDDLHDATVRESRSTQASIQGDIDKANAMRARAVETRKAAIAQLEATKAALTATRDGLFAGQAGPAAGIAVGSYMNRATELDAQIKAQNAAITKADEVVRLKRGAQIRQGVSESLDPTAAATGRYERTMDRLNSQLRAGKISEEAYRAELTRATEARNAATDAARKGSKASEDRARKVKAERDANEALERSFSTALKAAQAFNDELGRSLGVTLDKDVTKYWDGVANRQAEALGEITATADANAMWNSQLRDTVALLDQIGGAGAALGDIGRVMGALAGGNLGTLPGPAGLLGKSLGGIQWATIDSDGNRQIRQLGDEMLSVLDNVFGSRGSFSKVLESAGLGSAAGSLVLGGSNSGIGSAVGGALGEVAGKALGKGMSGILGSAMGPLGSVVGGILGGALGGAFKKTTSGFAVISNRGVTSGGNNADLAKGAANTGDSISAKLTAIAEQLGGNVGNYDVSIGTRSSGWISVSASGSSQVADKNWKKRNVGGDLIYDGKDAEEAARIALLNAIQDGAVQGIRAGAQTLLKAGKDLDRQLQRALDFETVFSDLKGYRDPVGAALDTLDHQFTRLQDIFAEAGASAAEYADLEALYGIKRAEAIDQANDKIIGSLRDLQKALTVGNDALSLRDRNSAALAIYNPLAERVKSGDVTAFDAFSQAASDLLDVQRQLFGSTSAYFATQDQVKALTDAAIYGQTAVADASTNRDSPFSDKAVTATVSAIDAQTSALIAALGGRLDALNDNTIAVWKQLVVNGSAAASAATPVTARGYF